MTVPDKDQRYHTNGVPETSGLQNETTSATNLPETAQNIMQITEKGQDEDIYNVPNTSISKENAMTDSNAENMSQLVEKSVEDGI
jgi:hypothetical protein